MHRFELRVYYEDTDMGGIVYHANYLKFVERARSDWVRGLGIDQNALRQAGVVFAVRRIVSDFLKPALFDDCLSVETRVLSRKPARVVLEQVVLRGGERLYASEVTLVALSRAGAPTRLPQALRDALT